MDLLENNNMLIEKIFEPQENLKTFNFQKIS